jgi:hypothetical protein
VTTPMPNEVVVINVDRTEVAQRGQRNGKPWVKYAVFGTYADGSTLPAAGGPAYYTFDKLPTGPVNVTIEPFTKHGSVDVLSFTVKKVRAAKPSGGAAVSDNEVVADLQDRVATLESQVARLLGQIRSERNALDNVGA